jgi:superfamily II DNA or RNA helicase
VSYADYLARKLEIDTPVGIANDVRLPDGMFPHQAALTKFALRRGRAAIFADTGLGKTRMQLAWADAVRKHTGDSVLILAPLAVATQTAAEGVEIGIAVNVCRRASDAKNGINITNYDRLHLFDPEQFGAVVLDESSCIKHHNTKTLAALLDAFARTPYKLCATATPAPNDWTELGTHAEFFGICTHAEMLSEYFVHDGGETQKWRLKGHAQQPFWRWVSSWGAMVRKPSDLGFDDTLYQLPPIHHHEHIVESAPMAGQLFPSQAQSLSERRGARRDSLDRRVAQCGNLVKDDGEQWIIWCDLNAEQDALASLFGDDCVSIYGSLDADDKEERLGQWLRNEKRILISKPSIFGWGLNFQQCRNMAFVGVTDSYEAYYQAVRRCWRFGQKRSVNVHVIASEAEGSVLANLKRKERDAEVMARQLSVCTNESVRQEVLGSTRQSNSYSPVEKLKLPAWLRAEAA